MLPSKGTPPTIRTLPSLPLSWYVWFCAGVLPFGSKICNDSNIPLTWLACILLSSAWNCCWFNNVISVLALISPSSSTATTVEDPSPTSIVLLVSMFARGSFCISSPFAAAKSSLFFCFNASRFNAFAALALSNAKSYLNSFSFRANLFSLIVYSWSLAAKSVAAFCISSIML